MNFSAFDVILQIYSAPNCLVCAAIFTWSEIIVSVSSHSIDCAMYTIQLLVAGVSVMFCCATSTATTLHCSLQWKLLVICCDRAHL